MKRKIVNHIVLIMALLLAQAVTVRAQLVYSTNNGSITITFYNPTSNVVVIPNAITVNGVSLPVTSIGVDAFDTDRLPPLNSVTVPEGVTNIGAFAFNGCFVLTNITLPDSLQTIGQQAFQLNGLTDVTFGSLLSSIGSAAFSQSLSLTQILIPGNVTNFGGGVFGDCYVLTNAFFLGNAPTVGVDPFIGDTNVTVYYMPGTQGWGAFSSNTAAPVVLWNPKIQDAALQNNTFSFTITAPTNLPVAVETATDLGGAWTPVQSFTLTNGSFYFSDLPQTNCSTRFYRLSPP